MKREARLYLQDIFISITKFQKYTANMTYEEFEEREMVIDVDLPKVLPRIKTILSEL